MYFHLVSEEKIFLFLFACSAALGLNSCGLGPSLGSNPSITPHEPYAISSIHAIHDSDWSISFEPLITRSPDGGATLFRKIDDLTYAFEHYDHNSLIMEWSIPFVQKKHEDWYPTILYRNGKLYSTGIESVDDGDSLTFRTVIIDPGMHQVTTDKRVFRDFQDEYRFRNLPQKTRYVTEVSPDSTQFLLARMARADEKEKSDVDAIILHCHIFDIFGKMIDSPVIRIPTQGISEAGSLKFEDYGMMGMKIDNDANVYVLMMTSNDSLAIYRFSAHGYGTADRLNISFPSPEFPVADYLLYPEFWRLDQHLQRVYLAAGHRKGKEGAMQDILGVSLDFASKQVRTMQFTPLKDSLKKWIDETDLENCMITNIIRDGESGPTTIVMQKSYVINFARAEWKKHPIGTGIEQVTEDNLNKGFVLFGFDGEGKPAYQFTFPNKAGHISSCSFTDPFHSMLQIFYLDNDIASAGIRRCTLDLVSGKLSAPELVFDCSPGTYLLPFTLWENPKSAIMFASGTGWNVTRRLIRNPIIFRLTTP